MNPFQLAEDVEIASLVRRQAGVLITRIKDAAGNDTLSISFEAVPMFRGAAPKPTEHAFVQLAVGKDGPTAGIATVRSVRD